MLPGLKFSTSTSAPSSRRSSTSRPAGLDRSSADRALVAVDADEVAGVAVLVEGRAPVAHLVALRRLELDDLGAVVGQDHGAVGPAEDARQVDHLQPGQRAGRPRQALAFACGQCVRHAAGFLFEDARAEFRVGLAASRRRPGRAAARVPPRRLGRLRHAAGAASKAKPVAARTLSTRLARMQAVQREARAVGMEAEDAAPGHQRLRRAAPEHAGRRDAGGRDICPRAPPARAANAPRGTGWCAARHVHERRAEGAGEAHGPAPATRRCRPG